MRMMAKRRMENLNKGRRPKLFEPGEKVYVLRMTRKFGETTMTHRPYEGPFYVVKKVRDYTYLVRKKDWPISNLWIVHSDRMRRVYESDSELVRSDDETELKEEEQLALQSPLNEGEQLVLRKSDRKSRLPAYLKEYELNSTRNH